MAYLPTQKWQVPVTPAATLNAAAGTGSVSAMPVAAELAPVRVIYGYAWVSSQVVNIVGDNDFYYEQIILGEGEINSVRIFKNTNGDPLPDGSSVTTYTGTAGQSVDAGLAAIFLSSKGITYTDTLPDIAYAVVKVPKEYGLVPLAIEVTGIKVYDPRSALTAHSDNPALALADFASNARYGLGLSVDWASVATVANACDALVGGQKRRTIGLCIDTPAQADQWLDTLATYAGCWAIIEGTTLKLVPDRPVATSRSFSHASGQILSIKNLKKRGAAGTPTVVDIRYRQPVAVWATNSAKAFAAGVLAGTTPYRESQVSLPGIWGYAQANREAIERLNKFQLADLSCTLEVFDEALALQPGDVVEVTHPIGLTAKPFRVQRIDSNLGRHTLDLLEYDPAVYSDAVEAEPTYSDTSLDSPLTVPDAVTALATAEELYQSSDGTVGSRLRITWDCADLWTVRYGVTIYRMTDAFGTGLTQVASSITSDKTYVHAPLEDGFWYRASVTVTRVQWDLTSTATTVSVQALGKLLPPSNVTSLTATITPAGVVLNWPAAIDIDLAGYRVKEGATLLATATTTTVNLGFVALGAHTYTVKAYDRSGGESATPASTLITVPAMGAVASLAGSVGSGDLALSWLGATSAWPIAGYEVRFGGANWAASTLAGTVNATRYTGAVGYTGARVWRVKALDVTGNYGSETTVTVTVTAPPAVTGFTSQFVGVDVQLNWALVTSDLPIKHYEIRHGSAWAGGTVSARVNASTFRQPVAWPSRQFWIAAVDTDGNFGTATATATATVVPPTQVASFTATLLQTDVRLDWAPSAVGSLAVAYYIVKFGGIYASGQLIANVNSTTLKVPVDWAGARTFWVAPVDPLGNVGSELSVVTTVAAPGAVSPSATLIAGKVSLSWAAASSGLPVKYYEIRHGASWAAGGLVAKADATDYRVPVTWLGARTFWIAAVDTNLVEGTPASVTATVSAPASPTVTQSITLDTANLVWTAPASSLPISDYEIRYGASWAAGTSVGRVLGTVLAVPVNWLGGRTFWVSAYDINSNVGTAGSATVTIAAPTAPTITAQVIDNNVLLYWGGSTGTLPINTYELRKGSTWAGGALIGQKSGGFTTVLETAAGTYTYWVAGVDTAGNYGTPAQYTASVAQPPDYVLNKQWDSTFTGTLSNMVVDIDGSRVMGAASTTTWADHFAGNGWAGPQDQVTAGYPVYVQPASLPAYYEEVFDYGTILAATKATLSYAGATVSGSPALTCSISTSPDNATWTTYAGFSAYGTAFRYAKARITCTGGQYGLAQFTLTLDSKIKNDAGTVACASTDSGGTVVTFSVPFVDVTAITVTALGTTPITAIYDFVDTPNPTSFKVLLFNSAGARISGTASWSIRGY